MGRSRYTVLPQNDFRGGINQEPENATPNQVLDARNLWCPFGFPETRPFYKPLGTVANFSGDDATPGNSVKYMTLDGSILIKSSDGSTVDAYATSGLTLDNANVNSYVYFGAELNSAEDINRCCGLYLDANSDPNSNDTKFVLEYWNGSSWEAIESKAILEMATAFTSSSGNIRPNGDLFGGRDLILFSAPRDWVATSSIFSATLTAESLGAVYWLRMRIRNNAVDSSCTLAGAALAKSNPDGVARVAGTAPFSGGRKFFYYCLQKDASYIDSWTGTPATTPASMEFVNWPFAALADSVEEFQAKNGVDLNWYGPLNSPGFYFDTREANYDAVRGNSAFVPQFDKLYINYDYKTIEISGDQRGRYVGDGQKTELHTSNLLWPDTFPAAYAKVESEDFLVGAGQRYSPEYIVQLDSWPEGKFILFFNGVLFMAHMKGNEHIVRWSAASPAFRVWPVESFSDLAEQDTSPITGLSSLTEFPVVFKNDSIWNMIFSGPAPTDVVGSGGQPQFTATKVVSGVGCVAHHSIARTPAGLLFLAEDGVYLYNGTSNVQKLSAPIEKTIQSINKHTREKASGVYWKTYNCYLLSIPVDGSVENNLVLVFDLKNNAWWIWDDMQADFFYKSEDAEDFEQVLFSDKYGRQFLLDEGIGSGNSAVTAWLETHRFTEQDFTTKRFRELRLYASSGEQSITVEAIPDDDENSSSSGSLGYTDSVEAKYGTAVLGTSICTAIKRRWRRFMFRKTAKNLRIKVSLVARYKKMKLHELTLGLLGLGRR